MTKLRTFTVSTRFLVISDTHDFKYNEESGPFRGSTDKVDVVLHCGDLTQVGGSSEYKRALKMLASIPAELRLVIAGNHDLSLDADYWKTVDADEQEGEKEDHAEAVDIMTGNLAKAAGVTYLTEGVHNFTLKSGARFTVYASPYQPRFGDWAFHYERNEDRFNPVGRAALGTVSISRNPVPDSPGVDIMITHGPPMGLLDDSAHGHLGCSSLLHALQRCRPRMHCFGHIHEGYGAKMVSWKEEGEAGEVETVYQKAVEKANSYPASGYCPIDFRKETLLVNAAIMDGENKPTNDPWLVDLDLQRV
ncbi:Metallophosphoesterase domain-containing protein [Lachnellula occidentalis]|uniref:Metallophosphoesterase domain-containing protein n=1 Tax=Lachnellula occidentalis TaxID=215460 RepID=A0A8H8RWT1_9HELO|nr:Metallophosphoesterase domain-containing protein [Lachnellula occidentalis]